MTSDEEDPPPRPEPEIWSGVYDHVVVPGLGEPHHILCEDCGVVVGVRQLPIGEDLTRPSGYICGDCTVGRRHAEERLEEERLEAAQADPLP
jgi:hypothetical protein